MDDKESLMAAVACHRDVPTDKPCATQDCSDAVNISIFFDGTGNNKDLDEQSKKWSNVARMWRSAQSLIGKGKPNYPIYISGVGTPFNGIATNWLDKALIAAQDNALVGGVAGGGGSRRTEFGQHNVNKTLRSVLLNNATKLGGTTKAYADKSQNRSLSELGKALAGHRLIKVINLSIFGFSRGAALARAFSNDFLKLCTTDTDGKLTYQGYPIRIHFMGLFDTVASFGIPAANLDWPWTEKNLTISGQVERCVHYVAAHELRFSFPVDLICQRGQLMSNWTEEVYPGSHSDVGGGYWPLTQENKSNNQADHQGISNNCARIPMRDMMSEAVLNGVRMLSYCVLEKSPALKNIFDERFAIQSETQDAYQRYMSAVPASGTVEQKINAHMTAMYAAYGTMARKKIKTPDVVLAQGNKAHALIGHVSMAREAEALLHSEKGTALLNDQAVKTAVIGAFNPIAAAPQALQFIGTAYGQVVKPEAWRLHAWKSTPNDAVLNFIKHYIHDSKSGFLMSIEPFSYFRPRGITESSRNVLAKGLQWLDENVEATKKNVIKIYYQAEAVVVETWKQGVLAATQTYKVGEKFVIDKVESGEKYAVEVYQTSKQVLITAIDQGQKMIVSSADTLQKKASSLLDTAEKSAAEMTQQIEQGAKEVSDVIGKTVDAAMKAIDDAWNANKAKVGL